MTSLQPHLPVPGGTPVPTPPPPATFDVLHPGEQPAASPSGMPLRDLHAGAKEAGAIEYASWTTSLQPLRR